MNYITGKKTINLKNTAIALGNFDGIHKGHQLLIEEVNKRKSDGLKSVVFTLYPHPSFVLGNKESVDLIFTQEERKIKFLELGIDVLVEYPFDLELSEMKPEDFIKDILIRQFGAKVIVVGSDFKFGKNRQGDIKLLKELATIYNYEVVIIHKKIYHNEKISSSLIRELIKVGSMQQVTELLGSPYMIYGEVVHGNKIGRTINMPTANIIPNKKKLLPPNGVYASRVIIDSVVYNSITNIGKNPTVYADDTKNKIESYIFDFNKEIYGNNIQVLLLDFIRKEKKFKGLEQLSLQIQIDVKKAKDFFRD